MTEKDCGGVRVLGGGQRLNVLASFAHSVLMGAIKPEELDAEARKALERTGLLSLDDVVALGVRVDAETLLRDLIEARKAWADAGENDHRLAELSAAFDAAWERAAAHVAGVSVPREGQQ